MFFYKCNFNSLFMLRLFHFPLCFFLFGMLMQFLKFCMLVLLASCGNFVPDISVLSFNVHFCQFIVGYPCNISLVPWTSPFQHLVSRFRPLSVFLLFPLVLALFLSVNLWQLILCLFQGIHFLTLESHSTCWIANWNVS